LDFMGDVLDRRCCRVTVEQLFKCKQCGENKTYEEMRKDARKKHGIIFECKKCRNDREAENGSLLKTRIRGFKRRNGEIELSISFDEMLELMRTDNCAYCGEEMSRERGRSTATTLTLDHVYGLGSEYGATNTIYNLFAVCSGCNSSKRNDHIYDFYQRSEKFTDELFTAFVAEFGRRLMQRELNDLEVEQLKLRFREEADDLRRNAERKAVSTG
jgi:DNA-directed RNA polymerase subunit M/transcription elongation factor TFIIS